MVKWLIIVTGCLVGCNTTQEKPKEETPVIQVVKNENKDEYIEKVEKEISEAGAALIASTKTPSVNRMLVDLTITRLGGFRQPTSQQVDEYLRAILDPTSMKAEKEKASKVDADATALWNKVEQKDKENKALKDAMQVMEERHRLEAEEKRLSDTVSSITKTCQWVGSLVLLAGVGLLIAGSLLGKPSKAGGLCIIVGGGVILLPMLIPTVITAPWFGYAVGGILVISIGWAMWDARDAHSSLKSRVRVSD